MPHRMFNTLKIAFILLIFWLHTDFSAAATKGSADPFVCLTPDVQLRKNQRVAGLNDSIQQPLLEASPKYGAPFPYAAYYGKRNKVDPFWGGFGNKQALPVSQLKRVVAYTYRGDTRDIKTLKRQGGFQPNCLFPKSIEFVRKLQKNQVHLESGLIETDIIELALKNHPTFLQGNQLNPYAHVIMPLQSCFISTTKSTVVARGFVDKGWVYVVLGEGGFDLSEVNFDRVYPELSTVLGVIKEQEVAVPGSIKFSNIVAYTEVRDNKFYGDICILKTIKNGRPRLFKKIYRALSS